jgi:ATP-dependent exoDNAse (exonuclease V) beta subunit
LEETALGAREDQRDDKKDKRKEHALTLMTLHSAKGLEFPRVYLVGMEEGLLPHTRSLLDGSHAIAEERRLAYVGVTRAKDLLTLSLAKQRMKWGKARPSIVSRFLLEMRGETEKANAAAQASEDQLARAMGGDGAAGSANAKAGAAAKPGKASAGKAGAGSAGAAGTKRTLKKKPGSSAARPAARTASASPTAKAKRSAAKAASVGHS